MGMLPVQPRSWPVVLAIVGCCGLGDTNNDLWLSMFPPLTVIEGSVASGAVMSGDAADATELLAGTFLCILGTI